MADFEGVIGEFGFTYTFTVRDGAGSPLPLTDFDTNQLIITETDFTAHSTITLSKTGNTGELQWTVASGDIPTSGGMYLAQIVMTDTGTKVRKTKHIDFKVIRKLD